MRITNYEDLIMKRGDYSKLSLDKRKKSCRSLVVISKYSCKYMRFRSLFAALGNDCIVNLTFYSYILA